MQLIGVPLFGAGLPVAIHPMGRVADMGIASGQLVLMMEPQPTLTEHEYGFLGFVEDDQPTPSDSRIVLPDAFVALQSGAQIHGRLIFRPCSRFDSQSIRG